MAMYNIKLRLTVYSSGDDHYEYSKQLFLTQNLVLYLKHKSSMTYDALWNVWRYISSEMENESLFQIANNFEDWAEHCY